MEAGFAQRGCRERLFACAYAGQNDCVHRMLRVLRHLAQMSKCRLNIAQRRSLGFVGCSVLHRDKERSHFSEIIKSMGALWQIDPILAPEEPGDKTVDLLHPHPRQVCQPFWRGRSLDAVETKR